MVLLLDFGNTRLKWAVATPSRTLLRQGAIEYVSAALDDWCRMLAVERICRIRYASVVTPEQEVDVLSRFPLPAERFEVTAAAGSLRNAYATPQTLGVDRWAAAIGAWSLVGQPCLVIGAGTATTIDLIEVDGAMGVYRGGLILPGVDLMLQSLHQRTARLPQATGVYRSAPDIADNTHDAMTSGAIEATCGAIERMGQRLPTGAAWLVNGGRAPLLKDALGDRLRIAEDLVLAGLAV